MDVEPATRRANLWLFVGLVMFAFALCALVLLWMRARTHLQGGKVYPPVGAVILCHPERSATESKDLPRSIGTGTWKVLRLRTCGAPLRMTENLQLAG